MNALHGLQNPCINLPSSACGEFLSQTASNSQMDEHSKNSGEVLTCHDDLWSNEGIGCHTGTSNAMTLSTHSQHMPHLNTLLTICYASTQASRSWRNETCASIKEVALTIPTIFGGVNNWARVMCEADLVHSIFLAVYCLQKPVYHMELPTIKAGEWFQTWRALFGLK